MPRNIGQEAARIGRELEQMTDANRIVLAYRFEQAAEQSRDGFTMDVFGNLYRAQEGYAVAVLSLIHI